MLTTSEYFAVLNALDQRAFLLMVESLGLLAPDTYAWRTLLQIAYMRAYLVRDSIRTALVAPPCPLPTAAEASLFPLADLLDRAR